MKIISNEHFERMNMMCRTFELNSKHNELFKPEYEISKEINRLIEIIEVPTEADFKKIEDLIVSINSTKHHNGSQWYDYKIHLTALLRANGANLILY